VFPVFRTGSAAPIRWLVLFHIGGSEADALITLAAAVFIAP